MENKHILISGAGIAGLTLAYWLKQYGFVPTLIEKHPILRTGGYKIDIRGAAVEVIKRMGLHSAIFDARTKIQQALFVDSSGKQVAQTTPDLCGVRVEGDLEIVRGDLCQILLKQVNDVECLFGDSIKSITQSENGAHVEFEKNEPRRFDLVIGADGLHSTVRKLAFGEESNYLRAFGLYVSFFSVPNFLELDRVEIEYHAPRRFAIAYGTKKDQMAIAGFVFPSELQYDYRNIGQQKKALEDAFAGSGWEIPRLLSFMKDAPDFYFDCVAQIHMPHYTKERVALVGDAGYAVSPISGQGASVALVGAYVLAGELALANGDFKKAFSQYEDCLQDFIKKNQKLAKMSAELMTEKPSFSGWLGRLFIKFLPEKAVLFFKNWGLKRTAKAANAVEIKNYPK